MTSYKKHENENLEVFSLLCNKEYLAALYSRDCEKDTGFIEHDLMKHIKALNQ